MQQALHIFRKDVRYLYREIGLMLALAALMPWVGSLLLVAALYLISRLIHAEAIPGDGQFWLTRPYRWRSLLGAKVLFIVVFISIPIGAAQLLLLVSGGFSLQWELPGLLWSQVLIFCCALLVMALATVTAGLVPFIFSALTVVTGIVIKEFAGPRTIPSVWPLGMDWIRDSILGVVLTAMAVGVILRQYRQRDTVRSSAAAVMAMALMVVMFIAMPVGLGLTVQSWFSKRPALAQPVQASIGLIRPEHRFGRGDSVFTSRLVIPVTVHGVPEGLEPIADGVSVTLEWPGEAAWKSGFIGVNRLGGGTFEATVNLPERVFRANRKAPLTVRSSMYLTLFGVADSRVIPLQSKPVSAPDGLLCRQVDFPKVGQSGTEFRSLACQSFFRWPARLVYANSGSADMDFNNLISYSPFPAGLSLNPKEAYSAGLQASATKAIIKTKAPLVHFRQDAELSGIRLADFR
jgi:hypothetical protein